MKSLLVVAGESSGDDWGGPVLACLRAPAWGIGGPSLVAAGMDSLAPLPNVMGFSAVARRLPHFLGLRSLLRRELERRSPAAALLIGFSDFNARLAAHLRKLAIRTLWLAPPQVWAWRQGRAPKLASRVDLMATLFDFEVDVWRRTGGAAVHVGHPAGLIDPGCRGRAREALRFEAGDRGLILLPGSRSQEVHRHARTMLEAGTRLRAAGKVTRIVLSLCRSLPASLARRVASLCTNAATEVIPGPAGPYLSAFDVAICCSGTATLECAAAYVPPVIVYDAGPATRLVATHLLSVPFVGLPNLLLGQRGFPELLGTEVRPAALAAAAEHLLHHRVPALLACKAVRAQLTPRHSPTLRGNTPSARVASLLEPWLD